MKKLPILLLMIVLLSIAVYSSSDNSVNLPPNIIKEIIHQKELALGITFLIALLAGLLTFTSPCSFVLLPIYFSFVFKGKKQSLIATSSFVIGLTIAFALFGLIAGFIGSYFNDYKLYLASVAGIFIAVFGIMIILNKGFGFFTPKISKGNISILSLMIFGFLFGVGWSPCTGPILGSILFLATTSGTLLRGILLMITYAMGIAIPLIIFAYFSDTVKLNYFISKIKVTNFKLLGYEITTNLYNIIFGLFVFIIGITIIFYKGTSYIEYVVSHTTGWVMNYFINLNNNLRVLGFPAFTSNILGILIATTVLAVLFYFIIKEIRNKASDKKEAKNRGSKHKGD